MKFQSREAQERLVALSAKKYAIEEQSNTQEQELAVQLENKKQLWEAEYAGV